MIERWIAAGVVPPHVQVRILADIVPTAAFGSVVLRQRALDRATVTDLVDFVLLPALTAPGTAG